MRGDTLPHWPMFRHDARHTGASPMVPAAGAAPRWIFETGGQIRSSPAVGLDGTVYVGSLDNKLYAVSPNGKLAWSFEALAYVFSSPAVAGDGTVYFGSVDGHLYAVRAGKLKWAVPLQNCAFSSPALAMDGTVYVGSNAWLLTAISPAGEPLWHFTAGGPISTTPAILPNGYVVFGSDDASLYAVKPDGSGAVAFRARGPVRSTRGGGSGRDDLLRLGRWTALCARRPGADEVDLERALGHPVLAGGRGGRHRRRGLRGPPRLRDPPRRSPSLEGEDRRARRLLARDRRRWHGLRRLRRRNASGPSAPNGDVRWTYKTGGTVFSSPAIGPDGTVYVGSADGRLYAFR